MWNHISHCALQIRWPFEQLAKHEFSITSPDGFLNPFSQSGIISASYRGSIEIAIVLSRKFKT